MTMNEFTINQQLMNYCQAQKNKLDITQVAALLTQVSKIFIQLKNCQK